VTAPAEIDESAEVIARVARRRRLRLLALVAIIVGLVVAARVSGLTQQLDKEKLQAAVQAAGPWGAVVLVASFVLAVVAHIPGTFFVAAAVLVYGKLGGYLLSLFAAILAVLASFLIYRAIGGQPLGEVRWRFVQRIFRRLDQRPLLWVFVLRTLMFISPPLNTALALSKVRFRDYAIGSAFGLVIPMAVVTFALDLLMGMPWAARFARALFG
jgi:uncharacterized membrane protein YdjX (TVP38/TMEM64 family)